MENNNFFGFIRDRLDIQILILYILARLPYEISGEKLADLALFDGGFTWFEYADALAALVQAEQAAEEDGKYVITEKGRRNVGYVGGSLPYSVRAKADRLTSAAAAQMNRDRLIETDAEKTADGACSVSLRLSDGVGEVMALRLTVPDEKTAADVEERFRKNAEKLSNRIMDILTSDQ